MIRMILFIIIMLSINSSAAMLAGMKCYYDHQINQIFQNKNLIQAAWKLLVQLAWHVLQTISLL